MGRVCEIEVKLPHPALDNADWADAWQATLEPGSRFSSSREAGNAIIAAFPKWTYPLLGLRQILMAPFGLKGPKHIEKIDLDSIGFFPVINETSRSIVAGFDDKHLDFRLVIDLEEKPNFQRVILSTIIRRNNWLGRAYLATILPFHRWIIKSSLANMRYKR